MAQNEREAHDQEQQRQQQIQLAREQHPQAIFDQMKTIAWGNTTLPVTQSYPKLEDMQELLQYPTLTLETVKYKHGNLLQGIQLVFKEGLNTPLFQTQYAIDKNYSLEQMSIYYSQITQVSVFIDDRNRDISGIRFNYSTSAYVEKEFYNYDSSEWQTREIPEGYQIVGMFVNNEYSGYNGLIHFGFNLLPIDRPPMP